MPQMSSRDTDCVGFLRSSWSVFDRQPYSPETCSVSTATSPIRMCGLWPTETWEFMKVLKLCELQSSTRDHEGDKKETPLEEETGPTCVECRDSPSLLNQHAAAASLLSILLNWRWQCAKNGKGKSPRPRVLVVIPPYTRCDSCHKTYTRARYWGKGKEHTYKDCGDSRTAGENRCESSWNDCGDRRREEICETRRRRYAEPLHPPPVQGKQCANPNCAILLPSAGQLCKRYCLTCYQHQKVHQGQEYHEGCAKRARSSSTKNIKNSPIADASLLPMG